MIFIGYISDFFRVQKNRIFDFSTAKKRITIDFFECENPLKFYFLHKVLLILINYSLIND